MRDSGKMSGEFFLVSTSVSSPFSPPYSQENGACSQAASAVMTFRNQITADRNETKLRAEHAPVHTAYAHVSLEEEPRA